MKEEKTDFFMVIAAGILGMIVGAYGYYETFGVEQIDYMRSHVDKLFCGKPQAGEASGPKCFIIREYKHPKLQEMIYKLKKEKEDKAIWKG